MKEKKRKKVYSVDKSLIGMEELAGAVLQRCSVNKVLWKIAQILMKFQAFRPTTLFKSDFCQGVFLWIWQSFRTSRISVKSCFWIS